MAMNPMGGIDQQITQRATRLKNDPNALMQQYGQSKNILDLIAAQRAAEKVQKEKQLAALQMQGNPPTVADQLEQTLIASEKEKMAPDLAGMKNLRERTKGVAGVLAQKQQQQQQRMQQMGQQPQPPQGQPQGRPMMAGGGLLSQRAPNLERMYGGGIVGFEVGGSVRSLLEEYRRQYPKLASSLSDEELLRKIQRETPTTVEAYRKGIYGSRGMSDEEIQQRIGESYTSKLAAAKRQDTEEQEKLDRLSGTPSAADRARAAAPLRQPILDPMAGMVSDTVTAEPLESKLPPVTEKITRGDVPTAITREPDVAAAAVEEIEEVKAPPSIQEQMDAALAPAQPKGMMFEPEVMQAGRQQAADKAAKEQFGRNAASLGLGGMSIRPLEKMTQAPEMLRRRAVTPLTLEQRYEALERKRLEDLEKDETALTDTRSNTRRLLDRLTDAAINASKRPAATSNRGALASFGLGISEAVRAEEKERKEGLAGIRERRNALLKAKQDRELAKAQISQGQQRVDTLGKRLEQEQAQFDRRMESQSEQFQRTMKLKENELANSNALNVIKAQNKATYDAAMLDIKGAELEAQVAFNDARTQQGNQTLQLRAADALGNYSSKLQEVQREAIDALSFNPQYKNNPDALKAAEKAIRLEFKTLIDAKKAEFAALGAGSSGLSESSEAALASLGI